MQFLIFHVKVVPVQLTYSEPYLFFVAKHTIEISEEILFDYNDQESKANFLKQCPVCLKLGTVPNSVVETVDLAEKTDVVASETHVGEKAEAMAATASTSPIVKPTILRDIIEKIAVKRKATKAERALPFEAFCLTYALSVHVTRSVVEAWVPGTDDYNVDYIMNRRRAAFMASSRK